MKKKIAARLLKTYRKPKEKLPPPPCCPMVRSTTTIKRESFFEFADAALRALRRGSPPLNQSTTPRTRVSNTCKKRPRLRMGNQTLRGTHESRTNIVWQIHIAPNSFSHIHAWQDAPLVKDRAAAAKHHPGLHFHSKTRFRRGSEENLFLINRINQFPL